MVCDNITNVVASLKLDPCTYMLIIYLHSHNRIVASKNILKINLIEVLNLEKDRDTKISTQQNFFFFVFPRSSMLKERDPDEHGCS